MIEYEIHPMAAALPSITGVEYIQLFESIKEHGQRVPIVLYEGRVVDGRNRLRACQELDIEPDVTDWVPPNPIGTKNMIEDDLMEWIIDVNVNRRHLTPSQRAMAAADIANARVGKSKKCSQDDDILPIGRINEDEQPAEPEVTRKTAAEKLGVSERSVARAAKVKKKAVAAVAEAVKDGTITVHKAEQIAELPKKKQLESLYADPKPKLKDGQCANWFDDEALNKQFGQFIRRVDDRNKVFPNSPHYQKAIQCLRQAFEHLKAWQKSTNSDAG